VLFQLQVTDFRLQMSQLLLAVDTSGKNGSLALALITTGENETRVLGVIPLDGGAFSAQLVPQIAALLEKHGRSKSDLGAFAVASGPGSFTGLRVGLAAIKALAEALQRPIVAVSLLEAVACGGGARGRVLAALDAGRADVYVGDYEVDADAPIYSRMFSERLMSRDELHGEVSGTGDKGKVVITPNATLAEALQSGGIHVQLIEHPNSAVIARLGSEHLRRGETVGPEELEANYIRRSDAELFLKSTP
jgi:tRNA threonylcarbamoyladenosine biosynthesis protein TsaB